jgi:hypothetical protein
MLKFENSESSSCIICNKKDGHRVKIKIMRTFNDQNLVTFDICTDCLEEMYGDVEDQLEFLEHCKCYNRE